MAAPRMLRHAALLTLGFTALAVQGALPFTDCRISTPGTMLEVPAECTSLSVPEDRGEPTAGALSLRIARVTASHPRERVDDPLYFLAGGPGQAATEAWPLLAWALRDLTRRRDVILIDQRGTGGSNRLDCAVNEANVDWAESLDPDEIRRQSRACLDGLAVDPRHYTTAQAADDIEAVREALGHGPINVLGVSYGTRLAQVYLRRHPASVRRLILDGVVPPTLALGTEHAPNLDASIRAVLARCESESGCQSHFAEPQARLQRIRERLRDSPQRTTLRMPRSGEYEEITVTPEVLGVSLRMLSYAGETQALIPLVLEAADRNDWQPLLVQALLSVESLQTQLARGLELAVTCSEDIPFFPATLDQSETLLGNLIVDALRIQCQEWPVAAVDEGFHAPMQFDAPALLLSGEFDPVTPPAYGEETLEQFPQGAHWVVPGAAHGALRHGCTATLVGRFLAGEDPKGIDTACLDGIRPPPFFVELTGPLP